MRYKANLWLQGPEEMPRTMRVETIIYPQSSPGCGVFITLAGNLSQKSWIKDMQKARSFAEFNQALQKGRDICNNESVDAALEHLALYTNPDPKVRKPPKITRVEITIRSRFD